ncbi:MFS transporter [Neisseria polysaccharea]|uniref:MFS transporter n=1 Tax=Neisseria polysaccharea TaxID=489 RepID=UPI0001D9D85E|nr:MFS transporter [Neisseria polysaccharea]EFH23260.1 transporter, major facilitator family protein [Neisseria polysaccharea ATCC 43768]
MSDNQTSPNSRDWLLLIGGSTYKFTLTGFYLVALVAILKNHSYSLNQLSWIHLIGGIEAAKVLFAALMERRPAGRFGRFRGWLLAATLGLSAVFGLMACTDITQNFALLLTCCVLLSAMSAVYGCAMLGLSCIVLPHRERGFGGVIQTMAARGGKMIGGALVLWLYQEYGQTAAAGFMLTFSLLMLLQLLYYREPESPTAQGSWTALAARLVSFWQQPETGWRWLVLLFAVAAPYAFMAATFVPKLADLGFTPKQTGGILAVGIPVACLIVTPLSGWFSRNYPRRKLVFLLYVLQLPLLASMTAIDTLARVHPWLPPAQIIALSLSYTLLLPVILALVMDKSDHATAVLDSSLQFSVVLLSSYISGFAALKIAVILGYGRVYWMGVVLAVCVGAILYACRGIYSNTL